MLLLLFVLLSASDQHTILVGKIKFEFRKFVLIKVSKTNLNHIKTNRLFEKDENKCGNGYQ